MPSSTLTQYRDQYIQRVKSRLLAADVASATDTELILQSALYKALDAVNRIDLIGPDALSLLAGMTGSELQTWLQDVSNRQAFESIVASSTAMQAVAASSTAMQAVAASATAMQAVAASSTAIQAVWASNTAADAVLTSTTAKNAIWESDTALAALQANPTQIARQIGISGRTQYASTGSPSFTFVAQGTRVILLRRWYSSNEYEYLRWSRSNGNLSTPSGRSLYDQPGCGSDSGTYNSNSSWCTSDGDVANMVVACNGLRRDTWTNSYTLYVRYIVV